MATDRPIPPGFRHEDLRFNGVHFAAPFLSNALLASSRKSPKSIDALLRPQLSSAELPSQLSALIKDYVSTQTTPAASRDGIPSRPRWYYANCAIFGMLFGRAFTLLSTPTRPPKTLSDPAHFPFSKLPAELRLQIYEHYKEDLARRQVLWNVMCDVFLKGLWSGGDAEEGARYVTGIIMLTSGHAMSLAAPLLRGRGRRYLWWEDRVAGLEHTWGWDQLRQAIFDTQGLPRDLYDSPAPNTMYVSREVLEAFDLAREHLRTDERDWTPPEIEARLMKGLFENEEARRIWIETGLVPRAYEQKFATEQDEFMRTF